MYFIFFYSSFRIVKGQPVLFLCLAKLCWIVRKCLLVEVNLTDSSKILHCFVISPSPRLLIESFCAEFVNFALSIGAKIRFAAKKKHFWTSKLLFFEIQFTLVVLLRYVTAGSGEKNFPTRLKTWNNYLFQTPQNCWSHQIFWILWKNMQFSVL